MRTTTLPYPLPHAALNQFAEERKKEEEIKRRPETFAPRQPVEVMTSSGMDGFDGGNGDREDLPLYKRLKVGDLVVARYSEDRLHYDAEVQQV